MEENKKQPQSTSEQQTESSDPKAPRRGRNWITDMYDKVNLSVDTLNYIALGLLIFIFAVIFIPPRHYHRTPCLHPPPLRLLKRTLEKASQFPIRGRIFFTSEHTVSRRKDASRWRRRAWDAHHFAKEEGSSHPQTRRALQALVCLQRSCFAASSAFREVPKKEGVVSLKRGNSFFVQKKHSDYENPNACGRM